MRALRLRQLPAVSGNAFLRLVPHGKLLFYLWAVVGERFLRCGLVLGGGRLGLLGLRRGIVPDRDGTANLLALRPGPLLVQRRGSRAEHMLALRRRFVLRLERRERMLELLGGHLPDINGGFKLHRLCRRYCVHDDRGVDIVGLRRVQCGHLCDGRLPVRELRGGIVFKRGRGR